MEANPTSTVPETPPDKADASPAERSGPVDRTPGPRPVEGGRDGAALLHSGADLLRGLVRSRKALILAGVVVVAAALALGWEWLAAAGVLPLLLAALPCVAMCALGLCMRGGSDQSCSSQTQQGAGGAPAVKPDAEPVKSESVKEIEK